MRLPELHFNTRYKQAAAALKRKGEQVLGFRGLNLTNNTKEGEFSDMLGLSSADYPYITQIPERLELLGYVSPTDIYVWDRDLFVVDGTTLKKNGVVIGTVLSGKKSMAVINTKLVIYPDKVYVDLTNDTIHPLAVKNETYGVAIVTDHSIEAAGIDTVFADGDVVDLIGTGITGSHIVVQAVEEDKITFVDGAISGTLSGPLTVKTSIPDLDFICSSNNRIFGCSNNDNTIYASGLGDPTDFFHYGSDAGAFSVVVGSEGDFTGICDYGGAVCVWKEEMLHKILGRYPSEYYMVDANVYGVQKGSEHSLCVINNVLYYKGVYGVYQYGGNRPAPLSYELGDEIFTNAVGASDGRKYYLSMADPNGAYHLYAYDLVNQLWMKEEDGRVSAMASLDRDIYLLSSGSVKKIGDAISGNLEWFGEFVATTENTFDRKGYAKILIRLDMTPGSLLAIKTKQDRDEFKTVWQQAAGDFMTLRIPLKIGRCDRFVIRLEGAGAVTVKGIGREFKQGSER